MNELSLFSGGGGGLLGTLLLGWKHIGYVEYDDYCQRIIAQRITDGILPEAPIFSDVREFAQSGAAREYRGFTDVVTAGFPCQPFSVAGKRAGADDERNMWPATIECIRMVRPRYALLENVPGLLASGYFGTILGDLAESGYDARWRILSAAELGAPHKRDRLWIVADDSRARAGLGSRRSGGSSRQEWQPAHPLESTLVRQEHGAISAEGIDTGNANVPHASRAQRRPPTQLGQSHVERQYVVPEGRQQGADGFADLRADVAHAARIGQREPANETNAKPASWHTRQEFSGGSWWEAEPAVGRVVDGYAGRVAELKAAGNAQVASVVRKAWELLA